MDRQGELRPLIIVGAPRSGTNILRDVLCRIGGLGTWPCDEINAIWRHGNRSSKTDELRPGDARPEVVRYIRRRFLRQQRRLGATRLVEKTCANSLRVPFVHAVFPGARFLSITRDGREAALSAVERWQAPIDIAYTLRKLRFAPAMDLGSLAFEYVLNRFSQLRDPSGTLQAWGPVFEGMASALAKRPLEEVCGLQWSSCVTSAEKALSDIEPSQVHRLRYEDFVDRPATSLRRVAEWLDIEASEAQLRAVVGDVASGLGGRWPAAVPIHRRERFLETVRPGLNMLGYDQETNRSSEQS